MAAHNRCTALSVIIMVTVLIISIVSARARARVDTRVHERRARASCIGRHKPLAIPPQVFEYTCSLARTVCVCLCVCVCVCVRARACVCVCARASLLVPGMRGAPRFCKAAATTTTVAAAAGRVKL